MEWTGTEMGGKCSTSFLTQCQEKHVTFTYDNPSLSLSLPFNSHFPGEPGLAGFIEAKDEESDGDNWSYRSCKAPVKSSPPKNQHQVFFTGRMPFLSPNQQCQSTEGKIFTFDDVEN